jgi:MOSC domain-containing protein YiiM
MNNRTVLGKVISIHSATAEYKGSIRPKVNTLNFIVDHGIENDKFALKDLSKTVMIVGQKAYDMANEIGIDLQYGSLGENIVASFDPHMLNVGEKILIGEVILEVTEPCTICSHLSIHDKKLPKLVKNDRGVYFKIIESGIVKENFEISKIEN